MIKRRFGMHHLNITQSRFSDDGSHKHLNAYDLAGEDTGIDYFYAPCDLEVVAVLPYATTGFANTVIMYDKINDCSLSFSHENSLSHCPECDLNVKVGDVYRKGDVCYREGRIGRASGNHVHFEIGKSRQTFKVKNKYGDWSLNNLLNIEDYFYLDDSITVVNDRGLNFERRGTQAMEKRYNRVLWNGWMVHSYVQDDNQKIGIISSPSVAVLDRLDDDRVHYCKVNGGYFGMDNWEHYGTEQGSVVDLAPKDAALECVYLRKGNKLIERCRCSDYWLKADEVEFALTPFATLYHGSDVCFVSTKYVNKLGWKNTQTFLIQLNSGRVVLNVCEGGMTPEDCVKYAKEKFGNELFHVSVYDSGGSSQMIVNGKYIYAKEKRKIANCLTLYSGKPVLGDNIPQTSDEGMSELDLANKKISELTAREQELVHAVDGMIEKLRKAKEALKEIVSWL